jgi:hypothetical protein
MKLLMDGKMPQQTIYFDEEEDEIIKEYQERTNPKISKMLAIKQIVRAYGEFVKESKKKGK